MERCISYYSWTWDISSFYVQPMNHRIQCCVYVIIQVWITLLALVCFHKCAWCYTCFTVGYQIKFLGLIGFKFLNTLTYRRTSNFFNLIFTCSLDSILRKCGQRQLRPMVTLALLHQILMWSKTVAHP